MTASAKRKREKKKDFQKAKLKVGKAKPKADNATSTAFKARSLILTQQSIAVSAPSASAQFSHHVSLLKSRADSQRRESLAHLTSTIAGWPVDLPLPEPAATLLPKLQPLVLDPSTAVRDQLLKLLRTLPVTAIRSQTAQLLLYTRAAMTHLSADIKLFAMDLLEWLLQAAGSQVVTCAGGWSKTLPCFMGLLGWEYAPPTGAYKGWSAGVQVSARPGKGGKLQARQLAGFAAFVGAGVPPPLPRRKSAGGNQDVSFPLCHVEQHGLPVRPDPYAQLNLFGGAGTQNEDEDAIMEDREDRQRMLAHTFEGPINAGLETALKEGGEVGRAGSALRKAVVDGLRDFDRDSLVL